MENSNPGAPFCTVFTFFVMYKIGTDTQDWRKFLHSKLDYFMNTEKSVLLCRPSLYVSNIEIFHHQLS